MDWHTIQLLVTGFGPGVAVTSVIFEITHPRGGFRSKGVVDQAFENASRPLPPSINDPWWGPREREAFGWDATEKFIAATDKILNPPAPIKQKLEDEWAKGRTRAKAQGHARKAKASDDSSFDHSFAELITTANRLAAAEAQDKARKAKALALPKAGYINEQDGPTLPWNTGNVHVGVRAAGMGYKAYFEWNGQFHAHRVWWPDWVINRTYAVDIPDSGSANAKGS